MTVIIKSKQGDQTLFLSVEGEMGGNTLREVEEAVGKHLDEGGADILLDLSRSTYMGSDALSLLLKTTKRVRAKRGTLVLYKLPKSIKGMLETTRMDQIFVITETPEEVSKYITGELSSLEESQTPVGKEEEVLLKLLPILDSFERAIDTAKRHSMPNTAWENVLKGVEIIKKQIQNLLLEYEIIPIPSEDRIFDPMVHNALESLETEAYPPNTIVEEFKKGYMRANRVIRYAQVKVTCLPKAKR